MQRIVLTLTLVSFPALVWAAEGSGSPFMDFLWKVVNFSVLVGLIYYFGRKPVGEGMQKSAEQAKKDLEDARQARKQAESELERFQTKLDSMKEEADNLLTKAREQAELEKQRIVDEGEATARKIKEQASFTIQQESKKAQQELRRWLAEELIQQTQDPLIKQLDQQPVEAQLENYLKDLETAGGVQ